MTLVVIAAGVLAGAAPVVPPSAWQVVRRRRGSATPGSRLIGSPSASSGRMPPGEHLRPGHGVEPGEDRAGATGTGRTTPCPHRRPRVTGASAAWYASSRPSTSGASSSPATTVDRARRTESWVPDTGPRVRGPAIGGGREKEGGTRERRGSPAVSRARADDPGGAGPAGRQSTTSASTIPTAKFGQRAGSQRSTSTSSPTSPTGTSARATTAGDRAAGEQRDGQVGVPPSRPLEEPRPRGGARRRRRPRWGCSTTARTRRGRCPARRSGS